jgi:hypothetical protein
MSELIHLISNYLLKDLSPFSKPGLFSFRLLANVGALFFFVFGYVLGCRALYRYLEPQWGDVLSLLALCALLFISSLILFLVSWLLKPKETHLKDYVSKIDDALREIPNNETIKNMISKMSPKTIASIFAIVAVTTYFTRHKKEI